MHVSSCRSLQRVSPAAHAPLHCPRSQTALHAGPSSVQAPSGPHTSGCDLLHRLASGVQTPLHALALQTKGHVEVSRQRPLSSHVCTIDVPLHRVVPGEQTPAHPVVEHTYVHGMPLLHVPVGPQVKKKLPSHFVVPGWQRPTHAPAVQRKGHVTSVFHAPVGPHENRSSPLHIFDPAAHSTSTTERSRGSLASRGGPVSDGGPASGIDPGSGPVSASRSTVGPASPARKSPSIWVQPIRAKPAVHARELNRGWMYFMRQLRNRTDWRNGQGGGGAQIFPVPQTSGGVHMPHSTATPHPLSAVPQFCPPVQASTGGFGVQPH